MAKSQVCTHPRVVIGEGNWVGPRRLRCKAKCILPDQGKYGESEVVAMFGVPSASRWTRGVTPADVLEWDQPRTEAYDSASERLIASA